MFSSRFSLSSVWSARGGEDEEKDKKLSQRLRCLQWVSPSHLEIESVASSTKAMTWLQRAQQELLMMDGRRSPSEKLRHVTQCCTHIFSILPVLLPSLLHCVYIQYCFLVYFTVYTYSTPGRQRTSCRRMTRLEFLDLLRT